MNSDFLNIHDAVTWEGKDLSCSSWTNEALIGRRLECYGVLTLPTFFPSKILNLCLLLYAGGRESGHLKYAPQMEKFGTCKAGKSEKVEVQSQNSSPLPALLTLPPIVPTTIICLLLLKRLVTQKCLHQNHFEVYLKERILGQMHPRLIFFRLGFKNIHIK